MSPEAAKKRGATTAAAAAEDAREGGSAPTIGMTEGRRSIVGSMVDEVEEADAANVTSPPPSRRRGAAEALLALIGGRSSGVGGADDESSGKGLSREVAVSIAMDDGTPKERHEGRDGGGDVVVVGDAGDAAAGTADAASSSQSSSDGCGAGAGDTAAKADAKKPQARRSRLKMKKQKRSSSSQVANTQQSSTQDDGQRFPDEAEATESLQEKKRKADEAPASAPAPAAAAAPTAASTEVKRGNGPVKRKKRKVGKKTASEASPGESQSSEATTTTTSSSLTPSPAAKPKPAPQAVSSAAKPSPNATRSAAAKPAPATSSTSSSFSPSPKKKRRTTFQEDVLLTLLRTAKPYTLKSLAKSLRTTDVAVHHVMLSLVDKELVIKKEFSSKGGGRTRELYWADQEAASAGAKGSKDAVGALERATPEEMRMAAEECVALRKRTGRIEGELTALQATPTNVALGRQVEEAERDAQQTKRRVEEARDRIRRASSASSSGGGGGASAAAATRPNDPVRMKKRINAMRGEWRQRRMKCNDFVDTMTDAMEKRVKDVRKLLEVETDDDVGAVMPPKHEL